MSERQWLLLLSLLPGMGRSALRHLLERQRVQRETPDTLLNLPDEALQTEYQFSKGALQTLRTEWETLLEKVIRLEAFLVRCGVRWVSFQDSAFPETLEQMPDPPALVFLYGNYSLLSQKSFALLASRTLSEAGQNLLEQVANVFLADGWLPWTSVGTKAYNRLMLCAVRSGGGYGLCLSRGLLDAFGDDLRKEPLASARIWRAQFDPDRCLALSPFRPHDHEIGHHNRYRDQMIAYLADAVIVVEARLNGYMAHLAQQLLQQGRDLYVVLNETNPAPANLQLIEQGAQPIRMSPL